MKIVDLQLNIDGLLCDSVEDYIEKVESVTDSSYSIVYEVLYEEEME